MRSDLLLTLTGHKTSLPRDKYGRPIMSGPHENILIKMALEEKKEAPDMTQFTAEMFELDEMIFRLACKKLDSEGWITGAVFTLDDRGFPTSVDLTNVRLTDEGREFEKQLG
ncbi:MAG: hypothetical protein IIV84_03195 [Selenomonadales bacterium]|nr:hypothetical protein [Selenomonadales bacterium]MBQ5637072.1 hypothetical protein [Selenomonadales bacterium]MBQ5745969.1 hypothetical protein [Selenomonadales bacterium]MBQ5833111.1 hypothetical protein [Selenomonadales bacterium]MBQ5859686.1 hypothetical protein [Selenomonadales bacterium]